MTWELPLWKYQNKDGSWDIGVYIGAPPPLLETPYSKKSKYVCSHRVLIEVHMLDGEAISEGVANCGFWDLLYWPKDLLISC